MKEIKFNKTEKDDQLIVDVELPRRFLQIEPVINFSNSDMIAYLEECDIKLQDYDLYADKANEPVLQGTWVFTKKQKKVNKPKTRSYNKNKDESKTGD